LVELKANLLFSHIAILAGSGSGKTVLLRRIVEEAALLGIPAIVLDPNNDLSRLGDAWPTHPETWGNGDAAKAEAYRACADVVIWTPGVSSGNPISLNLLPDFAAVGDKQDKETADDRSLTPDLTERRMFDEVVSKLETLRAGRLGVIVFDRPTPLAGCDRLIGPARVWESRTPYLATRHAGRRKDVAETLTSDLRVECERRGFPVPRVVELLETRGLPNGGGLKARAPLHFAVAIFGPLLLGRDSHVGGGIFAAGASRAGEVSAVLDQPS
jgi:hypothetical protein